MKKCTNCGIKIGNQYKYCPVCKCELPKRKIWPWILVGVICLAVFSSFSNDNNSDASYSTNNSISENEKNIKTQINKDEYQTFVYEEISKNPDLYKGKKCMFKGRVVQVKNSWLSSKILRINVSNGHRFNNDIVYVEYTPKSSEPEIMEDDRVIVYGTLDGNKSYSAIFGNEVTIPLLKAESLEIQNEQSFDTEGKIDDCDIKVIFLKKSKNNEAIVRLRFTNNTQETTNFSSLFDAKLYQNNVSCSQHYFCSDNNFLDNSHSDVKPKGSIDIDFCYKLQDNTPATFEVTSSYYLGNHKSDKIFKTFNL